MYYLLSGDTVVGEVPSLSVTGSSGAWETLVLDAYHLAHKLRPDPQAVMPLTALVGDYGDRAGLCNKVFMDLSGLDCLMLQKGAGDAGQITYGDLRGLETGIGPSWALAMARVRNFFTTKGE